MRGACTQRRLDETESPLLVTQHGFLATVQHIVILRIALVVICDGYSSIWHNLESSGKPISVRERETVFMMLACGMPVTDWFNCLDWCRETAWNGAPLFQVWGFDQCVVEKARWAGSMDVWLHCFWLSMIRSSVLISCLDLPAAINFPGTVSTNKPFLP